MKTHWWEIRWCSTINMTTHWHTETHSGGKYTSVERSIWPHSGPNTSPNHPISYVWPYIKRHRKYKKWAIDFLTRMHRWKAFRKQSHRKAAFMKHIHIYIYIIELSGYWAAGIELSSIFLFRLLKFNQVRYFLPRLLVFWSRTVLSEYCTLSSI